MTPGSSRLPRGGPAVSEVRERLIVERALSWALEQLGSRHYALRCLSFVEDAYERPNEIEIFGGSTARESAVDYGAAEAAGDPPRGAFVFFETSGPVGGVRRDWGHVGLATGDGLIIHAWPEVRVDDLRAMATLPSGDWTPLAYLGWAAPARILTGCRARQPEREERSDRPWHAGSAAEEARVEIRRLVVQLDETRSVAGHDLDRPTRRAVAAAVVANPFAGRYVEDLAELEALGAEVGALLADRALGMLGPDATVSAYGKGAIVGLDGELEHAAAILHPRFGAPVRARIGGGAAIIPSTKLVAGPGTMLTMPVTNKDDIWSFDEMDAATIAVPDAPRPDEILVCLVLAAGGRPGARTRKPG